MPAKTVIVGGGTGALGRLLCQQLALRGDRVVILSRDAAKARRAVPEAAECISWTNSPGSYHPIFEQADAIINLAGASIAAQRWTDSYKRELLSSRINATRSLVEAAGRAQKQDCVFLSASGVDYYGDKGQALVDEQSAAGENFLARLCVAWEQEARQAETHGMRTVMLRTGIVLDPHEGALAKLLPPFKLGLGGPILPGTQWWSWIHVDDIIGLYLFTLDTDHIHGPLNATAPNPEQNRDFSTILGHVLGRPALIPIPPFALQLMLGELSTSLLLEKHRSLPRKALYQVYQCRYDTLEPALADLLG